ncbi:hypothetical protein [Methylobacterium fujisawaense]
MQAEGTAFIEWNSRHSMAVVLLLKERSGGVSAGVDRNEAAIRSLVMDTPEELRSSFAVADTEAAIRIAAEWVSL